MMKILNPISQILCSIQCHIWMLPSLVIFLSALDDVTFARTYDLVVLIPDELNPSVFSDSLVRIGHLATDRVNSNEALTSLRQGGHSLRIKIKTAQCSERGAMKGVIDALLDKQPNSSTAAFIGKSKARLPSYTH